MGEGSGWRINGEPPEKGARPTKGASARGDFSLLHPVGKIIVVIFVAAVVVTVSLAVTFLIGWLIHLNGVVWGGDAGC